MRKGKMRMKLFTKTTAVIAGLVMAAILGAGAALIYSWQAKRTLDEVISKNVGDMLTAAELDIALLRQKGFIASYILGEGDVRWLEEMNRHEPVFRGLLSKAEGLAESPRERELVAQVARAFNEYDDKRDEIIRLFDRGDVAAAKAAYSTDLNALYMKVAAVTDELLDVNRSNIQLALAQGQKGVKRLTWIVASSVALIAALGAGLIYMLIRSVFDPLRRIAADLRDFSSDGQVAGLASDSADLTSLHFYLQTLFTEVTKTRSHLEDSRKALHHRERLARVGEVMAHVAHEIRNPLATIGGFARHLEKHPEDADKVREGAAIIAQETARLEKMLTDVMKYSRPVRVERRRQNLNEVVEHSLAVLSGQIPDGIKLRVALSPDLPTIEIDPDPVEQVVINLIKNSIEAMNGAGELEIATLSAASEVMLVIRDTGPGIPEQIREKIFQPFFTTKKKGNGLGLAICKQIIDEHEGAIEVDSIPGEGTTFKIRFFVETEPAKC
jgi:signal transduction histidine kinase